MNPGWLADVLGGEGSMISLPAGVRVLVATRRPAQGCDGLAALVRETLRLDPVFVLRAKPADRVDESGRNKTE